MGFHFKLEDISNQRIQTNEVTVDPSLFPSAPQRRNKPGSPEPWAVADLLGLNPAN